MQKHWPLQVSKATDLYILQILSPNIIWGYLEYTVIRHLNNLDECRRPNSKVAHMGNFKP
jgi:hypothetical protein